MKTLRIAGSLIILSIMTIGLSYCVSPEEDCEDNCYGYCLGANCHCNTGFMGVWCDQIDTSYFREYDSSEECDSNGNFGYIMSLTNEGGQLYLEGLGAFACLPGEPVKVKVSLNITTKKLEIESNQIFCDGDLEIIGGEASFNSKGGLDVQYQYRSTLVSQDNCTAVLSPIE